jgi:hypothetical protein
VLTANIATRQLYLQITEENIEQKKTWLTKINYIKGRKIQSILIYITHLHRAFQIFTSRTPVIHFGIKFGLVRSNKFDLFDRK